MNYKFFNKEKFNAEEVSSSLYDSNLGVKLIPDFINEEARQELYKEIHSNKESFRKAKENYGKAKQNFFMHYWGSYETESKFHPNFPLVSQCSEEYTRLTQEFVNKAQLTQKEVSSIGVHIYWKGQDKGIDPHRDLSNVQLVSVLVLEGFAPFYIADNHALENKVTYEPRAGSLLLMRGPRNELEKKLATKKDNSNYIPSLDPRPIHCVGPVEEERTVILLRHIREDSHA